MDNRFRSASTPRADSQRRGRRTSPRSTTDHTEVVGMVFQLSTWGMGESTDAASSPTSTSSAPPPVRQARDKGPGILASSPYSVGGLRILNRKGRRRFRMEHPYMPSGGLSVEGEEEEEEEIGGEDHEEDAGEVSLFPLSNQVGGHTRLLLLNDGTICKPLNARELNFYQHIPDEIQKFIPKFKDGSRGMAQATEEGNQSEPLSHVLEQPSIPSEKISRMFV